MNMAAGAVLIVISVLISVYAIPYGIDWLAQIFFDIFKETGNFAYRPIYAGLVHLSDRFMDYQWEVFWMGSLLCLALYVRQAQKKGLISKNKS
ncbi:hypothetical protein [Endozoicomonas acroporae]|uniref:hypothetical protein n=1 Tax=Endozoicomonas acroporae TaxID=1701104 RepID=UPI003D7AF804